MRSLKQLSALVLTLSVLGASAQGKKTEKVVVEGKPEMPAPKMKVMLAGGYYDLATPFSEGKYEMHHLPMPARLQANISYHHYESGHMVYVNEQVLARFHDDVAAFIRGTESGK